MTMLDYGESPQHLTERSEIERRIREYIALGSGIDSGLVIPGNADGPLPTDLYASVTHINTRRVGFPAEGYVGETLQQRTEIVGTYSVQWLRAGAAAAADRFWDWADSPFGHMRGTELGIRFLGLNGVQNIAEVIAEGYEERVSATARFGYFRFVDYTAGRVESMGISVSMNRADEVQIDLSA